MRTTSILALLAVAALLATPGAAAHKTVTNDEGNIRITWGFLDEPAVTMTKTGLDLTIRDNATGYAIPDLEDDLEVSLKWGDQVHAFEDFRGQHGSPGKYTGVITLSEPGLYTLVVKGTVNGTALDMEIPAAHEASPIEDTYFPAREASDNAALEARIADLEAQVAALRQQLQTQSETPATVTEQDGDGGDGANAVPGPGMPLLLAGALLAGLVLRRRS